MQSPSLLPDLADSLAQRRTMVDCQIRTFDVTDQLVIDSFLAVPREHYLPDNVRDLAYSDIGFTIPGSGDGEGGRYCLPPLILARLIQGGRVGGKDRVLDVACGMGYSTAVLARLSATVVALESSASLCDALKARLPGVKVVHGALNEGAPAEAPFDVILVNGMVERGLDDLFAQLAEGGRLLTIQRQVNDPTGRASKAIRFDKSNGQISSRVLFDASAPGLPVFSRAPAFVF